MDKRDVGDHQEHLQAMIPSVKAREQLQVAGDRSHTKHHHQIEESWYGPEN